MGEVFDATRSRPTTLRRRGEGVRGTDDHAPSRVATSARQDRLVAPRRTGPRRPRDRSPRARRLIASVPSMARVAVLGGGQLGWMLGLAGIPLGCSFAFLDPVESAPSRPVGELVVGELDGFYAASRVADRAAVFPYE